MAGEGFYDAGVLRQLATNLFYGCGYNFYRVENQLRADDQLVRSKAGSLLGSAMASVEAAESAYRREFLPPPTRAKPFPDAAAIGDAQRLERLAHAISALEAAMQHQPVPANDRMTQRYREEAPTLQALMQHDERLVGQCELLRSLVRLRMQPSFCANCPTSRPASKRFARLCANAIPCC
ncbi:MAG: hypothetical protein WA414_13325 [Acidobacteriaceae bacterium]